MTLHTLAIASDRGLRAPSARSRRHRPLPSLRAVVRLALWLLGTAAIPVAAAGSSGDGASAAPSAQLADAPRREVGQDAALTSPAPRAGLSRTAVVARYRGDYLAQAAVPAGWSGNVGQCEAGTTTNAHQQAVLARINYFRALAGLPAATLDATGAADLQAAALLMSANAALSHAPPSSWACFSAMGATGAASANLALGLYGVGAIDAYMDDSGSNNGAAGHRRWLLYPPRSTFATGDSTGGEGAPAANALGVFGALTTRPSTPEGVAWPPAGYVPYQNLPARSGRWSFSLAGADFTAASVAVTGPSGPLGVAREPVSTGYGDNTLVFVPHGVSYDAPASDALYTVTVSGIAGADVSSVTYRVIVIDPAVDDGTALPVTVVEYYHRRLDHYFVTWLPQEIAALDAGTFEGWARTGETFAAYATVQPGTSPVCRIYIVPPLGDSHFYGRDAAECAATLAAHPSLVLEASPFMALAVPVEGACPTGTVPVFRLFNDRRDANHRYTTNVLTRMAMEVAGWIAEGDGADRVAYCAPL